MADISLPSGIGGLTRFKEEYDSKFKISPAQVIVLIIAIIAFVASLRLFFPIKTVAEAFLSLI